tara:strand:- start:1051 stop:3489 length:2439 start_codon:yes stop_codon:yes gene_type:complete
MDNNNLIIECRQKKSNAVYNNGDWNTKLSKPYRIMAGDSIELSKIFIDTTNVSDNKVNIDNDLVLKMDMFLYFTNYLYTADMSYDDTNHKEDGKDYFLSETVSKSSPAYVGFDIITSIDFVCASEDKWGNFTAELKYIAVGNIPTIAYIVLPPLDYDDPSRSSHGSTYTAVGFNITAKRGAFANQNPSPLPSDGGYFQVNNGSKFKSANTGTSGGSQPQPTVGVPKGVPTKDYITPKIFTKNITLRAGNYEPSEICETLNNLMGENENVNTDFNLNNLCVSPFLTDSSVCIQNTEDFNIVLHSVQINSTNKNIVISTTSPHQYQIGQNITLSNLPSSINLGGLAFNTLNAVHQINNITYDDNNYIKSTFTFLDTGVQCSVSTTRILTQEIDRLVFTNGSSDIQVFYKSEDFHLNNLDSVQLNDYTGQGVFVGVNFINCIINKSLVVKELDTVNKNFKCALVGSGNTATSGGTLSSSGKYILEPQNTPLSGLLPTIITTEIQSDLRKLPREDGERYMEITSASRYWIGSNQLELDYDANTNLFFWKFLHSPLYHSGSTIVSSIGKNTTTAPTAPTNPFFHIGKIGGCCFHNLSATLVETGENFNFWSDKLGFNNKPFTNENGILQSGICVDYVETEKTLGGNDFVLPVFDNLGNGISTTSARPNLDSLINKLNTGTPANFRQVITDPTTLFSSNDLTTEINASRIVIESLLLKFGYYYIEIQAGFQNEMISEDTQSYNIHGIVNRYYSLGSFTSSEGGSQIYTHTGQPIYLNDIKIRILDSDKKLATFLGDDNTIFLQIQRGNPNQPYIPQKQ